MSRTFVLTAILIGTLTASCSGGTGSTSCDDLRGVLTHTVTEITGIESSSAFKQIPDTGALESVDQTNGTEFSNLIIELETSWIAEQHRLDAPSTIIQSFLNWIIPSALACSLIPPYEEFQPTVTSINIFSDSDFNADLTAGSDLSVAFEITELAQEGDSFHTLPNSEILASARAYSLRALWEGDALVATPITPENHVFTITLTLADGRAYTIRTAELLLSGV
jgi:hypothetical protein